MALDWLDVYRLWYEGVVTSQTGSVCPPLKTWSDPASRVRWERRKEERAGLANRTTHSRFKLIVQKMDADIASHITTGMTKGDALIAAAADLKAKYGNNKIKAYRALVAARRAAGVGGGEDDGT